MNKLLFIALVFASTAAMAQNTSGGQGGQQFEQRKAVIVQRIGDRIAKMQALQACAQAATDPQSLKACMPKRGGRGGGQGVSPQDGGAQGGGEQPESGPGDDSDGQL